MESKSFFFFRGSGGGGGQVRSWALQAKMSLYVFFFVLRIFVLVQQSFQVRTQKVTGSLESPNWQYIPLIYEVLVAVHNLRQQVFLRVDWCYLCNCLQHFFHENDDLNENMDLWRCRVYMPGCLTSPKHDIQFVILLSDDLQPGVSRIPMYKYVYTHYDSSKERLSCTSFYQTV